MMFSPGRVERKATKTTTVRLSRQEMHSTKLIPNRVCLSAQDHATGRPMKARAHRKHSLSDSRSMKLTSELLARTLSKEIDVTMLCEIPFCLYKLYKTTFL